MDKGSMLIKWRHEHYKAWDRYFGSKSKATNEEKLAEEAAYAAKRVQSVEAWYSSIVALRSP
jgi:hypothetical protein